MKNRNAIVLLFIANTISGVAQGISMLAIPWYFAQLGEMEKFGFVYILVNIISLFWVPYSGSIIDRYNRRNIFLFLTTVMGLLLLSTAGLGFWWGNLPWLMVAAVFMLTFFNYNIHYPNLYSLVQEITLPKDYSRITSYLEIQGQVTTMMAGALGAILLEGTQNGVLNVFGFEVKSLLNIPAWKIYEIFLLDASTYFLSFIIIYFIRYIPIAERKPEQGKLLQRLKVGFNYLKEHHHIFIFGVASYSIFVVVLLEGFYLGALYAKNHLEASGAVYANSQMYYAIGAIAAGAGIHWIFKWTTLPMAIIIMTFLMALVMIALFSSKSVLIFYGMLLLIGLMNSGTRVVRTTYLFREVPNQYFGRASGIFFLTNVCFRIVFLSIFSMPFFHQANQVIYSFVILSVFLFASGGVLVYFYRSFLEKE